MKKILIVVIILSNYFLTIHSQDLGNANSVYSKQQIQSAISAKNFEPHMQYNNGNVVTIKVRGIYNETNIRRVAYFGLTQLGLSLIHI